MGQTGGDGRAGPAGWPRKREDPGSVGETSAQIGPDPLCARAPGQRPPPRASGSVNHSSSPESVRHMSVTTAAQRRLLTNDDTP